MRGVVVIGGSARWFPLLPGRRLLRFAGLAAAAWTLLFLATAVNTNLYLRLADVSLVPTDHNNRLLANRRSDVGGDFVRQVREGAVSFFTGNQAKEEPPPADYPTETSPRQQNPFELNKLERADCKPQTKVAFAKTHKTGSSTVQNILLRYGVREDLVFAMPPNSWMFDLKKPLNGTLVTAGPWRDLGHFDIFAFHCRWDTDEVSRIVPGAKFFTILREPLAAFESNYIYMGVQGARKADINEFARKFAAKGEKRGEFAYVGKNNLLWDLGLSHTEVEDDEAIEAKIREVADRFDLVMIMERFEESVVLLADLLCWTLEDVMYLKQNARKSEYKTTPTNETRTIMKEWMAGDYKLYEHFLSEFDRRVEAFGRDRMSKVVAKLRQMNAELEDQCIDRNVDPNSTKKPKGMKTVEDLVADSRKPWCLPYSRRETDFCKMIREHQNHRVQELKLKGLLPSSDR